MKKEITALLLVFLMVLSSCSKDKARDVGDGDTPQPSSGVSIAAEDAGQNSRVEKESGKTIYPREEEKAEIQVSLTFGVATYVYVDEWDGYIVTSSGEGGSFELLDKINGIPVVAIDSYAFYGLSDIRGSVFIPETIIAIGDGAFAGCTGLSGDLFLPDSLQYIGNSVFEGCSGLNGILYVGKGLSSIPERAFRNCSGLKGDLLIPGSIKTIGSEAFRNCSGFFGALIIADSVEEIGEKAFYGCSGFTEGLCSETIAFIGDRAFDTLGE